MNGISGPGLSAALLSYDRASSAVTAAASQTSDGDADADGGSDLTGAMVGMDLAIYAVKANIAVLKSTDQMIGTLLDVKA